MAKLTTQDRKNLSPDQFAIPSKAPGPGSYPIEDAAHARNALSRVSGNGSPAEKAQVRAAVTKDFPGIGSGSQPKKTGSRFRNARMKGNGQS